jgi:hypothetical protein
VADWLVSLYGNCPGVRLENLELKNSRKYGLLLTNCAGTAENPVQLVGVNFRTSQPEQSAVRFEIQKHSVKAVDTNRFFRFEGCKFEGPGKKLTTPRLEDVDNSTLALPPDVKLERSVP